MVQNIKFEEVKSAVLISEIISHDEPRPASVRKLVKALRDGQVLPPVKISSTKENHWRKGAQGMERAGFGYSLHDGTSRFAALKDFFGPNAMIEVVIRRQIS